MTALPVITPTLVQRLSSTPRGARLARRLAVAQLDAWGFAHDSRTTEAVALVVAELAANAVTHGRVPGRDFELRLARESDGIRIEVSDTRSECHPPGPGHVTPPSPLAESGRGLLLVDALARHWEVVDREPPPGKTVRAVVAVLAPFENAFDPAPNIHSGA
ncbi:ATP-binding protein [Streptomyces lavendulae]|nr:ATP-binding protein [Streptomyces lavendulae]TXJ85466.1 ATP-binding protein [Streptomyces lavendulae]